jgi:hypothetical protein
MPTIFFSGREVWREITKRVKCSRRVRAAIAYVGRGALKQLPLRPNDVLLVDMSLEAVGQGVTDPREVAKFMRRRVAVFSRRNLHAKYLLLDDALFIGSANASQNSQVVLDEAAVMTTDLAARRLAAQCLRAWCTEPVRKRYLEECIAAYRPPKFKAARDSVVPRRRTANEPVRLWLIGGLRYASLPEEEEPLAEAAVKRAKGKRERPGRSQIDQIHYPTKLGLMQTMKAGDWAITCIGNSRGSEVWPPQQLLSVESYARGHGRRRWVMQFEAPSGREHVGLRRFQRAFRAAVEEAPWNGRRTKPVRDEHVADAILRLWTRDGKPSRQMRSRVG